MGRVFTDEKQRQWSVFIGVSQLRKVREQTSFDGAGLLLQETFQKLNDPVLLVDVLWVLLESQANAKQISQEEFAEGFVGDAIERALDSLVGAVSDFLPSTQRAALVVLWEQRTAAMTLVQQRINLLAAEKFGKCSRNSKPVLDSRRATKRSANSSKQPKRGKVK